MDKGVRARYGLVKVLLAAGVGVFMVGVGAGCDKSETVISVDEDGEATWTRTLTFTRGGVLGDQFDALKEVAEQPAPSIEEVLATEGLSDEQMVVMALLAATESEPEFGNPDNDTIVVNLAGVIDDITPPEGVNDPIPSTALAGTFSRTEDGYLRYTIKGERTEISQLDFTFDEESAGETSYQLTVPGTIISHNADDYDGTSLFWTWPAGTTPVLEAIWDPTQEQATDGSNALRRYGLLGIALLALCIGIAVLLTFRPSSFDDGDTLSGSSGAARYS